MLVFCTNSFRRSVSQSTGQAGLDLRDDRDTRKRSVHHLSDVIDGIAVFRDASWGQPGGSQIQMSAAGFGVYAQAHGMLNCFFLFIFIGDETDKKCDFILREFL